METHPSPRRQAPGGTAGRPGNVCRPIPADDLRAIFNPRTRRAIEARLNTPTTYERRLAERRHVVIRASAFERFCDWLGRSFGESPRGFAFFAATLAPLAIAAFCVGYFGLRELLAVLS